MMHAEHVLEMVQRPRPKMRTVEVRLWEVPVRETELNHLIQVRAAAERLVAWVDMGVASDQQQAAFDALREMVRHG